MEAKRKLKNIIVKEVSFVDKPANLRPFLFWKRDEEAVADPVAVEKKFQKLSVSFDSDGTVEGTKLTINGSDVTQLLSFGVNASKMGDEFGLYCSYTQTAKGEANGGFRPTYTYTLTKAQDAGEAEKVEAEGNTTTVVAKALDADVATVKDYLSDMPPALRASVENLVGAATGGPQVTKGDSMPDQKDGQAAAAPAIDVNAIATSVAGILQPIITKEVSTALDKFKADQQAAAEQAEKAADDMAAKVTAGELVEFKSEDDMNAQLAAEAQAEALEESNKDGK